MPKHADEPQPAVSLTPAMFHILLALADGERHGYGIMQEIDTRTGGAVRLGPGTLYGAIKRMLADGLIEESGERPDPALDDVRRRYYRLADVGRRAAAAEARRLEELVGQARAKRLLPALEKEPSSYVFTAASSRPPHPHLSPAARHLSS
jgi:DNA-binding PadR family transcriptional regulator